MNGIARREEIGESKLLKHSLVNSMGKVDFSAYLLCLPPPGHPFLLLLFLQAEIREMSSLRDGDVVAVGWRAVVTPVGLPQWGDAGGDNETMEEKGSNQGAQGKGRGARRGGRGSDEPRSSSGGGARPLGVVRRNSNRGKGGIAGGKFDSSRPSSAPDRASMRGRGGGRGGRQPLPPLNRGGRGGGTGTIYKTTTVCTVG